MGGRRRSFRTFGSERPDQSNHMRVPDQVRHCVVFLGIEGEGKEAPVRRIGTGFLISFDLGETGRITPYLVTAMHVLEGARAYGDEVLVSFNMPSGQIAWAPTRISAWEIADQTAEACDIAVTPVQPPEGSHWMAWPVDGRVTPSLVGEFGIGPGDEVFIIGLFATPTGESRNVPIVRIGNIAAMPEELVRTKIGRISAYLIEARSMGGLSGSPVFVQLGPRRADPRDGRIRSASGFALLGVLHGHWRIDTPAIPSEREIAAARDYSIANERFNMGIAIVTPFDKVVEHLSLPHHVADRDLQEKLYRKGGGSALKGDGA